MIFIDVLVVGAGPSGATAARVLAENNLKVLILEKKIIPRYKTCGGGITGRAQSLLPYSARSSLECHCTQVDMGVSPIGWMQSFKRDMPIISMAMRSDFDQALVRAAQDAGAILREDSAFLDFVQIEGGYEVQCGGGIVYCRRIVAADGAQSLVAKKAGFEALTKYSPAIEWELYVKPEKLAHYNNRARLDLNFYPGGYAWVFPKSDHLSVGLGGPPSPNMKKALESFLIQEKLDDYERAEKHGFILPAEIRPGPCARNGIFLVGDAAGFVDLLIGEGIYFGLLSGQLVAESIVESLIPRNRSAECLYLEKVKKIIYPQLKSSEALAKLFYLHPWIQKRIFPKIGSYIANQIIDVVMGKRCYPPISTGIFGAAWIVAKRYVRSEIGF